VGRDPGLIAVAPAVTQHRARAARHGDDDRVDRSRALSGGLLTAVQTTRPRDLGALFLVIGVFAILLVVSIALGSPPVR